MNNDTIENSQVKKELKWPSMCEKINKLFSKICMLKYSFKERVMNKKYQKDKPKNIF